MKKSIIVCMLTVMMYSCGDDEVLPTCEPIPESVALTANQALFLNLAFEQEFGQSAERLRKWNQPISIFVEGSASQEVLSEVDQVIAELNDLSTFISITKVTRIEDANLRFFLGEKEDYVALVEPGAAGIAEGNNGFATIAWNDNFEITRASGCVDVVNNSNLYSLKHIIREELAQTLGLINDTELDEESVFYQFTSTVNSYSEIDKKIISAMLGNDLNAGMCPNLALEIIK